MQKKYIVRLTNKEQERKPGSSTPDAFEHHARRQSVWTEYATTAPRNLRRSLPQPSNDWKPHAPVTSFQPDVLDRNVWRRPCGGLLLYPGLDAHPRRAWPDAGMAGLCAAAAVVRLHGSGLDQLDSLSEIPISSLTWVAGMVRS